MQLSTELVGLLISIIPIFFSILLLLRRPAKIGQWVGSVLLTACMSVLSMGFLMMRLTASCVSRETPCPPGSAQQPLSINIFQRFPECSACIPGEGLSSTAGFAVWLNSIQESCAVAAAAICTLASVAVLARFAGWVRRQSPAR